MMEVNPGFPESIKAYISHIERLIVEVNSGLTIQPLMQLSDGRAAFCDIHRKVVDLQNLVGTITKEMAIWRKEINALKSRQESLKELEVDLDGLIVHSLQNSKSLPTSNEKVTLTNQVDVNKENVEESKPKKKVVPQLNHVSHEEFAKVPRHVKSHMTLDVMNAGINEVNEILTAKYNLLHRPRKTLSLKEEKQRAVYLEQGKDVKGTQHSVFFVNEDIQRFGNMLKVKRKTKDTVFLVLRHLGIVKELHKGKITRYAILKS